MNNNQEMFAQVREAANMMLASLKQTVRARTEALLILSEDNPNVIGVAIQGALFQMYAEVAFISAMGERDLYMKMVDIMCHDLKDAFNELDARRAVIFPDDGVRHDRH